MVFIPSILSLSVFYHFTAPFYPSTKQLAWILTTLSSAVMTAASLPFLARYLSSGGDVSHVPALTPFASAVNRFFQAYLTADLVLGALYYPDQLALLTGWIHHIVYIAIVEVALRRSWAHIFCLCATMELPTFILSFTILNPRFRSNVLFALAFFLTRIMLHIVLLISYLLPSNRAHATGGSYLPCTVLTLVFPLHAMWFHGCVKGFMKRATPPPDTQPDPPVITVPGSFSLPAVRLKLSVQKWKGYSSTK